MKEVPYVVCIWKDAWADAVEGVSPKDAADKHRPSNLELRGWLVHEDDEGLSIFVERCIDPGEEYYRGRSFIPRSLVKSIEVVKLSRPRRKKQTSHTPPTDQTAP